MIQKSIQIDQNFDSAAAAVLVQKASRFNSRISLVAEDKTANAKSIMGIISMNLKGGDTVTIMADGEDESQVMPELENIFGN